MSTNTHDILRVLGERRRSLRMPMRVLAERSGVALSTVKRVLGGDSSAGFRRVASIADALGVDLKIRTTRTIASMLRQEAKDRANQVVGIVQGTSALEGQAVGRSAADVMRERAAADLMSGSGHRLWLK